MTTNRMQRERNTIRTMIEIYCHDKHHPTESLCVGCNYLLSYAMQRLDNCPFQVEKPTCAHCPIHCYKAEMRIQVREVMHYAGPRMIISHPILSILHLLDDKSKRPEIKARWHKN